MIRKSVCEQFFMVDISLYIVKNRVGRNKPPSHTTVRAVRHTAVQFKIKYVLMNSNLKY